MWGPIQEDLCPYLKRKRYQLTLSLSILQHEGLLFFFLFPVLVRVKGTQVSYGGNPEH